MTFWNGSGKDIRNNKSFKSVLKHICEKLLLVQFLQFEIAFSASTRCLCVSLFCLLVDLLCCFNVQICMLQLVIQIQNAIQNTNFLPWQFERHTLQICKIKPWLDHTTINNYHWFTDPKFCMQCLGIFQEDGKPKSTYQSQNALCGPHIDI